MSAVDISSSVTSDLFSLKVKQKCCRVFEILLFIQVLLLGGVFPSAQFFLFSVYGPSQTVSDASQTPARPDLPTTRSAQEGPPVHLHPDPVSGSALDPQVHRSCHYFPCDGKQNGYILAITSYYSFQFLEMQVKGLLLLEF